VEDESLRRHVPLSSLHALKQRKLVNAQPENEKPLSVLALINAELGDREKAIHEGRTACDMLPVSKDALDGGALITKSSPCLRAH